MAFGFSDIGSMFSKGMGQYGQGLDKMRDLPMANKMMAAGQILHGGITPATMFGAVNGLGQPLGAPGQPPGTTPAPVMAPPPVPAMQPPSSGQPDSSSLFSALLPMLMKSGGTGPLGSLGAGAGGMGGLLSGFGFGGH